MLYLTCELWSSVLTPWDPESQILVCDNWLYHVLCINIFIACFTFHNYSPSYLDKLQHGYAIGRSYIHTGKHYVLQVNYPFKVSHSQYSICFCLNTFVFYLLFLKKNIFYFPCYLCMESNCCNYACYTCDVLGRVSIQLYVHHSLFVYLSMYIKLYMFVLFYNIYFPFILLISLYIPLWWVGLSMFSQNSL